MTNDRDSNGIYIGDIETDRTKKPIYGVFPEADQRAAEGKCVVCSKTYTEEERATWPVAGQREWYISSCCDPCFNILFNEPEDDIEE